MWKGLERKARDARPFLPPDLCTRCDVTEESETHFVREATIVGQNLREIIVLEPGSKVTFFQAAGLREGAIVTELFEDEAGGLQLMFTATWAYATRHRAVPRSRPSRRSSTVTRATGLRCCRPSNAPASCWQTARSGPRHIIFWGLTMIVVEPRRHARPCVDAPMSATRPKVGRSVIP